MIYVIEGPDGTGKTTLAKAIETAVQGTTIHAGLHRPEHMEEYHRRLFVCGAWLDNHGVPAILDRWAPSEAVYGSVYRGGQAYDTDALIYFCTVAGLLPPAVRWIYCRNKDAIHNHTQSIREGRREYQAEIGQLVVEYDRYVQDRMKLGWVTYDFSEDDIDDFVERVTP